MFFDDKIKNLNSALEVTGPKFLEAPLDLLISLSMSWHVRSRDRGDNSQRKQRSLEWRRLHLWQWHCLLFYTLI